MSHVNDFLTNLQNGLFNVGGRPVFYSVLGDSAYRAGGWRCFQSYYRAFNGAELEDELRDVNYFLKSARMTIKKNYGMVSCPCSIYAQISMNTSLQRRGRMLASSCVFVISCSIVISASTMTKPALQIRLDVPHLDSGII